MSDQLTRAAESIVLNIAEGAAHLSTGKKRYHYQIAYASAHECIAAVTRLHDRYPTLDVRRIRRSADMICVMLMPLIKEDPPALENR
jgi:four helix bundle protein